MFETVCHLVDQRFVTFKSRKYFSWWNICYVTFVSQKVSIYTWIPSHRAWKDFQGGIDHVVISNNNFDSKCFIVQIHLKNIKKNWKQNEDIRNILLRFVKKLLLRNSKRIFERGYCNICSQKGQLEKTWSWKVLSRN